MDDSREASPDWLRTFQELFTRHNCSFKHILRGTLEGFTFDSDDEADKMTKDVIGDQNEGGEEKPNKKTKRKAEKKSVKPAATKKKGKDVGGKQPKKRKSLAPKKAKAKK